MRLQNRVALVTGAGSGIGFAIAKAFADEGADVAINYLGYEDEARTLAQAIKAKGQKAIAVRADVSQSADVQQMVQTVVQQLGRLDILVNNAGIEHDTAFLDLPEEQWDKVLGVNLKGCFLCSQAAAREMVKQKRGRIINMSSIHEDVVFICHADYAASKGGMRMFTRTIAQELAPYNITVNDICPGAIETPINKTTLESGGLVQELLEEIPLNRLGQTADVAAMAVFLASDDASYVTGASFRVDGGMSIKGGSL
ncbi:MAG TPA: glucose 1-dehydrogenase [Dehalococcoidia bacterium]|nr:glucose 1-dehydrogenase [Dehalococcoidia bacterium]